MVNESESRTMTQDEAEAEIRGMWGELAPMGANDFELPHFESYIAQMKRGEISPEEAVAKAKEIYSRKRDIIG